MRLKNLILILGIVMYPLHAMCVDPITNLSGQPDATSVILKWSPYAGTQSIEKYTVKRNNQVVGSTICKMGYFSDFGLRPGNSYQYRVQGFNANGDLICESGLLEIQTTTETEIKTDYTLLAIVFDPTGEKQSEMPRIENFLKYRLEFLRNATHNSVNLSLYQDQILIIQDYPPLPDEPSTWVSYEKLALQHYSELSSMNMVDLVEKYEVDVIWVLGTPSGYDFGENALIGNHNLGDNEWISKKVPCSRSFFIHSNTPDARAYDAAAHHIEGTLTSASSIDSSAWPRDKEFMVFAKAQNDNSTYPKKLHLFEIFRLTDEFNEINAYASKGNANCGSCHFVPGSIRNSSVKDYTYYDIEAYKRYIDSYADNWINYPDFSDTPRKFNGYEHGMFDYYRLGQTSNYQEFGEASYHLWWFNHVPHNQGVSNGKLNNWWPYVYDCNRFDGRYINYPVSGFPITPTDHQPVNREYGTEMADADSWSFWHSTSWRSQRADLQTIQKNQNPDKVIAGEKALKVSVQMDVDYGNRKGRNELTYPRYKNAHWSLNESDAITFSLKFDSLQLIQGTNPIFSLCTNKNHRIEYVPITNGLFVNLFSFPANMSENGWFTFSIPVSGNEKWSRKLIGHVDPDLNEQEKQAEKERLIREVLSDVNYLMVSIELNDTRGKTFTYYVDNIRFEGESLPVIQNVASTPDATSVKLNWTPFSGVPAVSSYRVKRNGIEVGSTSGKYGYFTDINLRPNTSYEYIVEGLHLGSEVCRSLPVTVTTASSTEIRTDYTVLALVYDDGSIQNYLPRIRNYVQYRIDLLRNASNNSVNIHVYGDDITIFQGGPPIFIKSSIDYHQLASKNNPELNNQSIVDLVENYEIDMVWIVYLPQYYSTNQFNLLGNHTSFTSPAGYKVNCSRSFLIYSCTPGFNYTLHEEARYIDYIMTNMAKANPQPWQRVKYYMVYSPNINENTLYNQRLRLFEIFKLTDEWAGPDNYAAKDNANCGTGLFIPGTIRKPDDHSVSSVSDSVAWMRYVDCYADDWLNYPNFSWNGRKINGYEHGAFNHYVLGESQYSFRFGEASYHYWWLNHIPNNPGTYFGMLNNWWPYIFDLNRFTGAYVDYEVTGFPEIPSGYSIVNKEYGTESFNAGDWSFWHSTSWRGQRADISIAQKSSDAENVLNGNQSIKVDIAMNIPELHHKTGRNDLIYPRYKNAHWSFSENHILTLSIKPESTKVITGTNPIIRLCTNGNNRIEYVPVNNGLYTNLFNDPAHHNESGWYTFSIPLSGNNQWQRNLVSYINPDLSPEAKESEKAKIINDILSEVNYVEISIQLQDISGNTFTLYLDNFTIYGKQAAVITPGDLVFTYSGQPVSLHFTTLPAGLETLLLYNGLTEAPVDAGNYELSIEIIDPLYYGEYSGTLIIENAMLTVKAQDETRKMKEDNPEFTLIYEGFAEGEDEDVLDIKPTAYCSADWFSTPGTYDITISGGEDKNYNFTYIFGKLTILPVTGIPQNKHHPKHQHKHQHKILPNPVDKWLYIECPETGPIHIQILSSWGKKIIEINDTSSQINVQKLQPGMYIIVIDGNRYKFIKR